MVAGDSEALQAAVVLVEGQVAAAQKVAVASRVVAAMAAVPRVAEVVAKVVA